MFFDIAEAIRNPQHLDSLEFSSLLTRNVGLAEETSACWQTDTSAIIAAGTEVEDAESAKELSGKRLRPRGVAVFDLRESQYVTDCLLEEPAGVVMPIGHTHVFAFYKQPRLIRLDDGLVEFAIPHLNSGTQLSSIIWDQKPPILALDPMHRRFALVQDQRIHIVSIVGPIVEPNVEQPGSSRGS